MSKLLTRLRAEIATNGIPSLADAISRSRGLRDLSRVDTYANLKSSMPSELTWSPDKAIVDPSSRCR